MLVASSVHTIGTQHASRLLVAVYTLLDPSMLVASSVHTIGPQHASVHTIGTQLVTSSVHTIGPQHASRLQCTHYWTPAC